MILFPLRTIASACPTGYIEISASSYIVISPSCTSAQTDLGPIATDCTTSECYPEYTCGASYSNLKFSNSVSVPVYAGMHTSPSLHVLFGETECTIPLVIGLKSGTLNLQSNSTTYHVSALHSCLKLNASTTPSVTTPASYTVNWTATSDGTAISGISHCSSSTGSISSTASALTISSTIADNKYCWCRILSPADSWWAYATAYASDTTCYSGCAAACASTFQSNQTFRASLINSMMM